MFNHTIASVEFADKFRDLVRDQADWSQSTFGSDQERGPLGPLKHLEKEAKEAQDNPSDIMEHADCLLLVLDASRRAGFKPMQLVEAAMRKMEINKDREWPKDTPKDTAVEHVRVILSWGVYDIDGAGEEWYLARSEDEALSSAKKLWGEGSSDFEYADRLTDEQLNQMTYRDENGNSRSFREELNNRIEKGPVPEAFASANY